MVKNILYCVRCKEHKPSEDFYKLRKYKGWCKNCVLKYNRVKHQDDLFGGNREKAIQRDGEKCVMCGITREQHKIRYGRDITVDHINSLGTFVPREKRDNRLENLQTLCCTCHGRKDRPNVKNLAVGERCGSSKLKEWQVVELREEYNNGKTNISQLAREKGMPIMTVYGIIRGINWSYLLKSEDKK